MINLTLQYAATYLCDSLVNNGFTVHYNFSSTGTLFIRTDYGSLPDIRMADRAVKFTVSLKFDFALETKEKWTDSNNCSHFPICQEYLDYIVNHFTHLRLLEYLRLGLNKFNALTTRGEIIFSEEILSHSESIVYLHIGKGIYKANIEYKQKNQIGIKDNRVFREYPN